MALARDEKETIINWNEKDELASIYTYSKAWQHHLEKKLGLKPINVYELGAREYLIDKKRIRPPRAPLKLSDEARAKLARRLKDSQKK